MFRFKQFTIKQDRTAMKVCTDACVLGGYADVATAADPAPATSGTRILDIGAGTGLLALMAAQRNPNACVDAVEVDAAAVEQATENVAASPFAGRVQVIQGRIQDFRPDVQYDRILTNPPFYTNHLRSSDPAVNRALHTDELPFSDLTEAIVRLMKPDGQWWVLLPPYESERLALQAKQAGLMVFKRLSIRHNAKKNCFRVITGFSFRESGVDDETLTIFEPAEPAMSGKKAPQETYTSEFRTLLRDYYLIF